MGIGKPANKCSSFGINEEYLEMGRSIGWFSGITIGKNSAYFISIGLFSVISIGIGQFSGICSNFGIVQSLIVFIFTVQNFMIETCKFKLTTLNCLTTVILC